METAPSASSIVGMPSQAPPLLYPSRQYSITNSGNAFKLSSQPQQSSSPSVAYVSYQSSPSSSSVSNNSELSVSASSVPVTAIVSSLRYTHQNNSTSAIVNGSSSNHPTSQPPPPPPPSQPLHPPPSSTTASSVATTFSELNHLPSSAMGRVERNEVSNATSVFQYVPPKRPYFNSEYPSSLIRRSPRVYDIDDDERDYPDAPSSYSDYVAGESWADRYQASANNVLYPRKPFKPRNKRPESYMDVAGIEAIPGPPIKRHKFADAFKHYEPIQPLHVDVDRGVYPSVEAISPTLPTTSPEACPPPEPERASEPKSGEDSKSFLSSSNAEDLPKTAQEISKTICELQDELRSFELEDNKHKEKKEKPEIADCTYQEFVPKHLQLIKSIYSRNQGAAERAYEPFNKFGYTDTYPLYNQAPDTSVFHENKRKYALIRPYLVERIRREKQAKEMRDQAIVNAYVRFYVEWKRKVDKVENSQKRKVRDQKHRELFEKVFPELRKQREDKERLSRTGGRVKTDSETAPPSANGEETPENGAHLVEKEKKKEGDEKKASVPNFAVIPPLLLDPSQRKCVFINNNGRMYDFFEQYMQKQREVMWSQAEKEIFKEKFLQHPKQFGIIASYLEKKTACDCVGYYYVSKKTENYKRLLRKSRQRTRSKPQNKVDSATKALVAGSDYLYNNTSGVTTRLQREQQQRNTLAEMETAAESSIIQDNVGAVATPSPQRSPRNSILSTVIQDISSSSVPPPQMSTVPSAVDDALVNSSSVISIENEPSLDAQKTTSTSSPVLVSSVPATDTSGNSVATTSGATTATETVASGAATRRSVLFPGESKLEMKKKERRREDKRKNDALNDDSSDEEIDASAKNTPYPCIVCKIESTGSRALPRSHAQQYGLKEDDVLPGARVCNLCRCKAIRSRYVRCPLPSCPNAKSNRVKRLRPLPSKWNDLSLRLKLDIVSEFQIPENTTKCCSACFNRIQRKLLAVTGNSSQIEGELTPVAGSNVASTSVPGINSTAPSTKWTDEETELLRRGIAEHGVKWSDVCQVVGSSKTQYQCRNFYFNFRKKLGLDVALKEYQKSHSSEERRPELSTDEESGSTTSSCDELERIVVDDSDTISATSPINPDVIAVEEATPMITDEIPPLPEPLTAGSVIMKMSTMEGREGSGSPSHVPRATSVSSLPGCSPRRRTSSVTTTHSSNPKDEYDSEATETADEGPSMSMDGDRFMSPPPHVLPSSILVSRVTSPSVVSGRGDETAATDLTFKDLMLGVIEMQLKKNQTTQHSALSAQATSVASTISSILKSDYPGVSDRDVHVIRSRESAFTSVISSGIPHPQVSSHDLGKDDVVVLQAQHQQQHPTQSLRESESMTLDLSMKKPRTSPEYANNNTTNNSHNVSSIIHHSSNVIQKPIHQQPTIVSLPQPHSVHTLKYATPPSQAVLAPPSLDAQHHYYQTQSQSQSQPQLVEVARVSKTGEPLYWKVPPGHQLVMQPHPMFVKQQQQSHLKQPVKVSSPQQFINTSSKMSQKPTGNVLSNSSTVGASNQQSKSAGSIMHGTPVSTTTLYPVQPPPPPRDGRYENPVIRQVTPPHHANQVIKDSPVGSITQGTPVHQRAGSSSAKYYPQTALKRTTAIPAPGFYPPRPHSYSVEQRQIIMNDYLTSQQISSNVPSVRTPEKTPTPYYYPSRQGVIQRHNTNTGISKSTSPHSVYPSGHEGLGSLAEVTVRQPIATVSSPATISASSHKDDKPRHIIREGLGDRFLRDGPPQERYANQEQERYYRESQQHHEHYAQQQQQQQQQLREMQQQQQQQQREEAREHQLQQHYREQQKCREQQMHQHQQESHIAYQRTAPLGGGARIILQDQHSARMQQLSSQPPQPQPQLYNPHRASEATLLESARVIQSPVAGSAAAANQNVNYRESPMLKQQDTIRDTTIRQVGGPRTGSQGETGTLMTAASLIDAIITHQINQVNDPGVQATATAIPTTHIQTQRPAEKLFQVFPEPSGKMSPLKQGTILTRLSPELKSQQPHISPPNQGQHSPAIIMSQSRPPSRQSPHQIHQPQQQFIANSTERLETSSPSRIVQQSHNAYTEAHSWKLRRALQQRELEQQQQQQNERNIVRMAGNQMPPSPRQRYMLTEQQPPVSLSPLDYVKNKIVEAMRTSEQDVQPKTPRSPNVDPAGPEENSEQSSQQQRHSPATSSSSCYSYTTYGMNPQPQGSSVSPSVITKPLTIEQEPGPSAVVSQPKYEPISDDEE